MEFFLKMGLEMALEIMSLLFTDMYQYFICNNSDLICDSLGCWNLKEHLYINIFICIFWIPPYDAAGLKAGLQSWQHLCL